MEDALRYGFVLFLVGLLTFRVDSIFRRKKPHVLEWALNKLSGPVDQKLKRQVTDRLPPLQSDEEVAVARKKQEELKLRALALGIWDGTFELVFSQRMHPTGVSGASLAAEEVFSDADPDELSRIVKNVHGLMHSCVGGAVVGGATSGREAIDQLRDEFPGFGDRAYQLALGRSCMSYR